MESKHDPTLRPYSVLVIGVLIALLLLAAGLLVAASITVVLAAIIATYLRYRRPADRRH